MAEFLTGLNICLLKTFRVTASTSSFVSLFLSFLFILALYQVTASSFVSLFPSFLFILVILALYQVWKGNHWDLNREQEGDKLMIGRSQPGLGGGDQIRWSGQVGQVGQVKVTRWGGPGGGDQVRWVRWSWRWPGGSTVMILPGRRRSPYVLNRQVPSK